MEPEQDEGNPTLRQRETVAVNPARLAWKSAGQEICAGDIHASYSADLIADGGRIRRPFKWRDGLWVCTSISGSGLTDSGKPEHEAYRIVSEKMFVGAPTTYREKTARAEDAEAARDDPNGFYHGMTIRHGGENFVLCGPPIRFTADTSPERPGCTAGEDPSQLTLF